MFNLFKNKEVDNKAMNINNKNEVNPSSVAEMTHYQELYSELMDNNEAGIVTDIMGAKNTAMELCKKDPAMVKVWAEEKDPVAKKGILQSMLVGINKDKN